MITNSFKSDLDQRINSETNQITLLLSCFRKEIIKHFKTTSLLLGSPTIGKVHVTSRKQTSKCTVFQKRRARWSTDRTVTLEHSLRIVMASPQKSINAQTWVMSTTTLVTWSGLWAKRCMEYDAFTFPLCAMSPFWRKKKITEFS